MAEHKWAELLRYAAENADARFEWKDAEGRWCEFFFGEMPKIADVVMNTDRIWRIYHPPKPDVIEYLNDYKTAVGAWHPSIDACNNATTSARTGIIRRTINGETGKVTYCAVNENGEEV